VYRAATKRPVPSRGQAVSARELAEPYPYVVADDDACEAARLPVERRLPAPLVVDRDGQPYAALATPQLIGPLLAPDALTDPQFAVATDDRSLDEALERLAGVTVAQWLPRLRVRPPTVTTQASVTHIAALMARTHSPLVAVTAARLSKTTVGGT
jgi:hypothetical protein